MMDSVKMRMIWASPKSVHPDKSASSRLLSTMESQLIVEDVPQILVNLALMIIKKE